MGEQVMKPKTVLKNKELLGLDSLAKRSVVRVLNGRVIGLSLLDPSVKKELSEERARRRANVEALRLEYVKNGLLTPTGKLAKRYGG